MNNDTENPIAPETQMPDEDNLNVQSGSKSWRFANGKMVQGQEIEKEVEVDGQKHVLKTGSYPQEKKTVAGILRRVGIHKNPAGKYGAEHKLEADIETKNGMEHYSSSLIGTKGEFKVGISALNFAWCLTQFGKDAPIMLQTAQGEPIILEGGTKGPRPTYVNAFRVEGNNATPIYRPRRDPLEPKLDMDQQWALLEPQIRAHPAFAERETREDDEAVNGPSHLAELIKECEAKGIPSPSQAPGAWLARLAERNNHPVKPKLTDYDDHFWGEVRQNFAGLTEVPPWLAAFVPAPTQGALI